MTTFVSSIRAAPAAVLAFGFGGLAPFGGLAALVQLAPEGAAVWRTALAHYGAVILAFVGALQWGYAVEQQARGARAWRRYGWSVLPALVGWGSLQLPIAIALQVQAAMLVVSVAVDRAFAATFAAPAWLMPVRYTLTAVAAACLLVASKGN